MVHDDSPYGAQFNRRRFAGDVAGNIRLGASLSDETALHFRGTGTQGGEFLLFDLA